jgi:uncharacterized protein
MEKTIIDFIKKQKVATLCCIDEIGLPYCFSCFFSFYDKDGILYFKSNPATRHAVLMKTNIHVGGTILPDKLNVLAIQGVQFSGHVAELNENDQRAASRHYHAKYPFAMAMTGDVWAIQLTGIKMTDNSKGFGKKIVWEKDAELVG